MKTHKVLVIDDETFIVASIQLILEQNGYSVDTATSAVEGIAKVKENPYQYGVIVLDYMLPGTDGAEVAREILKINSEIKIAIHSGFGTIDLVRETFKAGAIDFIQKGKDPDLFVKAIDAVYRKFEESRSVPLNWRLSSNEKLISLLGMAGTSTSMTEVAKKVFKFRSSHSPILILGENGTGKELIAKAIWQNSLRKDQKFVVQNFAALNEGLLESELFGHMRGSFTNAVRDKKGLFEQADNGTLFLDEIGDASPALQSKLLRVLQEGTFIPVGGDHTKKVDVRIIAATNKDLPDLIRQGKFREDLYYRLNVLSVELPPLRKRVEDIEPLVAFFCHKFAEQSGKNKKFLIRTVRQLEKYPWPGNIRELQNVIERLWALSGDDAKIEPQHLESRFFDETMHDNPEYTSMTWSKFEDWAERKKREYVKNILRNSRTKSEAALKMGISPSTLHSIMKNLKLYREGDELSIAVGGQP